MFLLTGISYMIMTFLMLDIFWLLNVSIKGGIEAWVSWGVIFLLICLDVKVIKFVLAKLSGLFEKTRKQL